MSLVPTVYSSSDAGAPQLTGQPGSLAAILDAVLVSGYGDKAGLGWSLDFSSGYKRAYRNSLAEGGTGLYFRLDDTNAQYALVSGYHSMTDVDAGVDGFALTNNCWPKSTTVNTTVRNWYIVGNSRTFYVFIQNGYTSGGSTPYGGWLVGDYECLNKEFQFNFCVGHSNNAALTTSYPRSNLLSAGTDGGYGAMVGARTYNGATIGAPLNPRGLIAGQQFLGGSGGLAYPHLPTGGMVASRVVLNISGLLFGLLPGMWVPEHAKILTSFAEYSELKGLPDGRLLAVESYANNSFCQGLLQLEKAWSY